MFFQFFFFPISIFPIFFSIFFLSIFFLFSFLFFFYFLSGFVLFSVFFFLFFPLLLPCPTAAILPKSPFFPPDGATAKKNFPFPADSIFTLQFSCSSLKIGSSQSILSLKMPHFTPNRPPPPALPGPAPPGDKTTKPYFALGALKKKNSKKFQI